MRPSKIRQKLSRGEYVLLGHSWIVPHWKVVDIIGLLGFDGVWIENEHSDFTHSEISRLILAARARDIDSLVRVGRTGYAEIIKHLEAGATGIIVPHCMGAEDAHSIARDAKFHPIGMRGIGGGVDTQYGTMDRQEYYRQANSETLVAVIIEDREAVDEVDAIAATDGIDILIIGPDDLCQTYGYNRREQSIIDEVTGAISEACAKHGKWWGGTVFGRERAEEMVRRGGRVLIPGNDQDALVAGYRQFKESAAGLDVS